MNYYYVPQPHVKRASDETDKPNTKTYTLKMLRQCVGSELPLHVDVSATKMEEGFAVYNITTSSVCTQNRWTASYRYSEFLAFRNQVEEVWTCHDPKCSGSCQSVRDLVEACFPKKGLNMLSTTAHTVADRQTKFKNVLVHLLRSILLPGSSMKCFHARQNLPCHVFDFLGVKEEADKRSLLQVYVDNHQGGMKKSASHPALSTMAHQSSMKKSATTPNLSMMELEAEEKTEVATVEPAKTSQCMICLDDVDNTHEHNEEDNAPIELPCKHTFHRECIFEWLLFQYHCPVCRAQVGPCAVTNYARPKNQVQWWLGNFKENPLSRDAE
ncbi:hypothetical protein BBJ28_00020213 [Nothophytophthora sp. Chile5]|nr:hypothetical protein BBJ28_00020213 [Nothophytophthora sp. Chile5]